MEGSHTPTLHNLQSHFCHTGERQQYGASLNNAPDRSHETVYEEFVLFCRCLFSRIPNLGIASFHEPTFEVDRVGNVGVRADFVSR